MKVLWTEAAIRKLEEIGSYVSRFDPTAAERLLDQLVTLGDSLCNMAGRGRRVPEFPEGDLRELIHGKYRVVYRTVATRVEILTVFEGHRTFPEEDITGSR